jgi:hypothetical protein
MRSWYCGQGDLYVHIAQHVAVVRNIVATYVPEIEFLRKWGETMFYGKITGFLVVLVE